MGAAESNLGSALRGGGHGRGSRCRNWRNSFICSSSRFRGVIVFLMSSRYLHPLACRLPRAEREAVVAIAVARGVSVSGLIKLALRQYLAGVHPGVNAGSNLPAASVGPKPPATRQQPSQPRSLSEAFEASRRAVPTSVNANGNGCWVDTDNRAVGTALNRRLKPRPQRPPQSGKYFIDT